MRKYTIAKRTINRKDSNGKLNPWTSKTFYVSYYENRQRRFIDTGKENLEEAEKVANKIISDLEGNSLKQFLQRNKWLSATENPLFIESNNGSINYHYLYGESLANSRYLQVIINQFNDPIGEKNYNELTKKDVTELKERLAKIQEYEDASGKKRKATTTFRNGILMAFSTIYSYYLRTGTSGIENNPFLKIEKFKSQKEIKKKFIFTPEMIKVIFDRSVLENITPVSIYKDSDGTVRPLTEYRWKRIINSIYYDLFKFIAFTGMRGNEAVAICIKQFDKKYDFRVLNINRAYKSGLIKEIVDNNESNGITVFGKPKNNESRTIVLCDEAYNIVKKYSEGKNDDDLLFSLKNDTSFSSILYSQRRSKEFRWFIDELNQQFGFTDEDNDEELSLHGFRTSLNTNLIERTDIRESLIAYYLGWTSKSLTTTQRKHYTRYSIKDLLSVANEINLMYSGESITWQPNVDKKNELNYERRKNEILGKTDSKKSWYIKFKKVLIELEEFIDNKQYDRNEFVEQLGEFVYTNDIMLQQTMANLDVLLYANPEEITFEVIIDMAYDEGLKIIEKYNVEIIDEFYNLIGEYDTKWDIAIKVRLKKEKERERKMKVIEEIDNRNGNRNLQNRLDEITEEILYEPHTYDTVDALEVLERELDFKL